MSDYSTLARFYDAIHADLQADVDFMLGLARQKQVERALVLGCGTGRILLPLAKMGIDVVGIDNSAEMLAIARKKCQKLPSSVQAHIHLIDGDMTDFKLNQPAELVVIGYNTLLHCPPSGLNGLLHSVKAALATGGLFVVDVLNPLWMAELADDEQFSAETSWQDPRTGQQITQFARTTTHHPRQEIQIDWRFATDDKQLVEISETYHYRLPHQLQMALAQQKFTLRHMLGGYDHQPFSEESERLILIAA